MSDEVIERKVAQGTPFGLAAPWQVPVPGSVKRRNVIQQTLRYIYGI